MKREVELAKKLLESKGYSVSKQMNESGGHAWMINHPSYDPVGAPAISDEDREESKKAGEDREKAYLAKRREEEGAPDDYEYNGVLNKFVKYNDDKTDFEVWNESKELKEDKFVAYYMKNPRGYGARTEIKTFDNEKDADEFCNLQNKNGGYEAENGKKYTVDYDWIEESEEVLKPQNESNDLQYVCNTNGYSCYRKIENGKGVWFAKRQDDPDDKMFPISYDQARGFKEMPDETEIEKLQREVGKMLLPQNESTDDRQQRRIVRSIANEVIQSRGENNSVGTYDNFIRKMVSNWATSGQDRDFVKAAIEKSFDKEFGVSESSKPEWQYIEYTEDGPEAHSVATEEEAQREIDRLKKEGTRTKGPTPISRRDESRTPLQNALLKSIKKLHESDHIVITKPDDLVGKPSPKFKVTYSTRKGETSSQYIEATDEESAKAIIRGRCKRTGKTPNFISVERFSES